VVILLMAPRYLPLSSSVLLEDEQGTVVAFSSHYLPQASIYGKVGHDLY
jgi:hypothetical protein